MHVDIQEPGDSRIVERIVWFHPPTEDRKERCDLNLFNNRYCGTGIDRRAGRYLSSSMTREQKRFGDIRQYALIRKGGGYRLLPEAVG